MPNWCENTLRASKKVIDSIVDSTGNVNFNLIKHLPSVLNKISASSTPFWSDSKEPLTEQDKEWLQAEFGATDWYAWCITNWGTKWNASYTYRTEDDVITFSTAWSPPEGFYEALSRKFPNEILVTTALEEGCGYHFERHYHNGVRISDHDLPLPEYDEEGEVIEQ